MKFKSLFLLLVVVGLSTGPAIAQTLNADNLRNVDIAALSDDEIRSYYTKAKGTGLSDEQLFAMATQRGLPADQLQKLKERLTKLNAGVKTNAGQTMPPPGTSKDGKPEIQKAESEEAARPAMKPVLRDSSIFGSELFSEVSSVFEPNYRIATPASYTLGPGDELTVQVYGYSEQTYRLPVSAEGNIYIQNVGPLAVLGLSVEEAASRIRSRMAATIYRAIGTGQTKVQTTLSKIRTIGVTVIGQATKPGTYNISSLSTLFNLLYLCGGPSGNGSFRKIELVRGSQRRQIDLYSFLLRGDRKDNVLLQDQDVVVIPYYQMRVTVEGEVRRPGKFEMLANESLDQLMTYCGGFSDSAFRASVKLMRISDTGRLLADVPADQMGSFLPRSGDVMRVGKALNRFNNRVTVRGAVYRPGDYELKPGMQLKQLIELAGGLRPDAFKARGIIARLKDDLSAASVSFDVSGVLTGKEAIGLVREDIVTISSLFDLRDQQVVDVQGAVRAPGSLAYREGLTLRDVIQLSGGFAEGADKANVEIARRMPEVDVNTDAYRQSELIKVDLSAGLASAGANEVLKPFDLVLIRNRGNFERQRSVVVEGQVLSPGRYSLENSKETISQLLQRAGGFKGSADSSAILIKRAANYSLSATERQLIMERLLDVSRDSLMSNPELREQMLKEIDFLSVNVERIKANPGGPEDLILEDGDYIEVARASNLVRVSGEVYRPGLLPFAEGTSARKYIRESGSYTTAARKSKTFVIYPDGRAIPVKRFLFFKSYPIVTPRSEVFVPSKEREGKKGLTTAEWIAISSISATLATMIISVVNAVR
ncbi:MAG: SLBB domain-containing protein [Chitinophagaceae bacterium]|nr:SLBB domain-containing protein [Chitinophagaceae bacterium]